MSKKPAAVVIEGPSINKSDKELVQSILGGEMKNAWQKADAGAADVRPLTSKGRTNRRPHSAAFRENYDRIFRR